MITQVRHSVFETNSSSTHSVSVDGGSGVSYDIIVPVNGEIVLTGGEWGWEKERYYDAYTKANYVSFHSRDNEFGLSMIEKVIKHHTGADKVTFAFDESSYIDHQSDYAESRFLDEYLNDPIKLATLLFDRVYAIETDNDNY